MAGIINTEKVLNNTWNVGEDLQALSGTIKINSDMYKQYDFAMTDDPVLLQDKKSTQELLYKIFKESPYFEKYGEIDTFITRYLDKLRPNKTKYRINLNTSKRQKKPRPKKK